MIYTLTNEGTEILEWEAKSNVNWMTLDQSGGLILPGESKKIVVNINTFTKTLYPGKYNGIITFKNNTMDQVLIEKNVVLIVTPFAQSIGTALLSVDGEPSNFVFRKEGSTL